MTNWFLDTTVLIAVATGRSAAARHWYDHVCVSDRFMASRFLEVEARHLVNNSGANPMLLDSYLAGIDFIEADAKLMFEAAAIPGVISAADSIHLATALRVFNDDPVIVTHDAQFARAVRSLALRVHDPVTDHPARAPAG